MTDQIITGQGPTLKEIAEMFDGEVELMIRLIVKHQRAICKKYFPKTILSGFDLDFEKANIVGHYRPGWERLLIVPGGYTANIGYQANDKQFPCSSYDYIDEAIVHNDRDASRGCYAIFCRDRREADEELKNLSAREIWQENILGQTLAERVYHEMVFWDETGDHLDYRSWTLCSGSRYDDGNIPFVYWNVDEFKVDYCHPDGHNDNIRVRAVVPCQPKVG